MTILEIAIKFQELKNLKNREELTNNLKLKLKFVGWYNMNPEKQITFIDKQFLKMEKDGKFLEGIILCRGMVSGKLIE